MSSPSARLNDTTNLENIYQTNNTRGGHMAKKESKYYLYINKDGIDGSASLDGIDGRRSEK